MRKSLFVLASSAAWVTISQAVAQYVYPAPGYVLPPPGYVLPPAAPGYMWREQRLNRPSPEDGQQNYETQGTPNSTTGTGAIGVTDPNAVGGECAKGMSEETCRRRGQRYNPPRQD